MQGARLRGGLLSQGSEGRPAGATILPELSPELGAGVRGPGSRQTHVGVAGAMPPSLTQAVLAPYSWPGRHEWEGERRWGRGP